MRGWMLATLVALAMGLVPPAMGQSLFDKLKGAAQKVTGSGGGASTGGRHLGEALGVDQTAASSYR